jgi:hypothetical protein
VDPVAYQAKFIFEVATSGLEGIRINGEWSAQNNHRSAIFWSADSRGVSLRFVPSVTAIVVPNGNSHWEVHDTYRGTEKYMLWPVEGNLRVSGCGNL